MAINIKFLSGISQLPSMATSLVGLNFTSFIIGNEAGFTPNGDEVNPVGNISFVGQRNDIKLTHFDNDQSFRISLLIAEEYSDIEVGNVILYAKYENKVIPMLMLVLPHVVIKRNTETAIIESGFPYPGTRMIISITVKYVSPDEIQTNYTVNIVSPEYSQLPFFGSDLEIPAGDANPWSQFIVNDMTVSGGTPALVIKDLNDQYFTTPLWQNVMYPKYGILDGGYDEGIRRYFWIWGLRYHFANQNFQGSYGGASYSDEPEDLDIVGGENYIFTE